MWVVMATCFYKALIITTSVQNIVILGAQGLMILMGSKFLIKMTRLHNNYCVWWPGDLYQKF